MSPNPKQLEFDLDIPLGDGDSPWAETYAGAVPEITFEDVENAFPTECVELPVHEQIARALEDTRNVQRPTHAIAAWIRKAWAR